MELERREAIGMYIDDYSLDFCALLSFMVNFILFVCQFLGEMLKLNPSFKAPADYKPLLKEANVPIPVSEHFSSI